LSSQVFRNGVAVQNGDAYVEGEVLTVTFGGDTKAFLLEASGGALFTNGGCGGVRFDEQNAKLALPLAEGVPLKDVGIVAGWAQEFGTVTIAPAFVLKGTARRLM
jgi:hypothetical protein